MSIGVILYDIEDSKSMVLANIPNEPDIEVWISPEILYYVFF